MKISRSIALSALFLTATTLVAVDMTDARSADHDLSLDFQDLQARSRELVAAQAYRDRIKKNLDEIEDKIAVSVEDHEDFLTQSNGVFMVSITSEKAINNLEDLGQLFHQGSRANYALAITERDVEILSMALTRSWLSWSEER